MQVGLTVDGLPVSDGAFWLYDTHGIPIDVMQDWARESGFIFSMDHFIRDALKAGWSLSQAWTTCKPA